MLYVTYVTVKKENMSCLAERYTEHFQITHLILENYFSEMESDLLAIANKTEVRIENDENFTSFLDADPETFEYHYTEEELAIIGIFYNMVVTHPHINLVYMGRENGTYVRALPRPYETQFDPRVRSWYVAAKANPGTVQMVPANTSASNEDIFIAFSTALVNAEGEVYGVVAINVTIEQLSDAIAKQNLVFNGYMEFVDENNIIAITSIDEHLYKPYVEDETYKSVSVSDTLTIDRNKEYYRIKYNAESWGGQFMAYAPVASVDSYLYESLQSRLIISLIVLIVMELWSFLMIRNNFSKPIKELLQALQVSQEGEIPTKINIKAGHEFKQFEKQYNEVVANLHNEQEELNKIRDLTISNLSSITAMRDFETGLHLVRTSKYVELISQKYNLMFPDDIIHSRKIEIMTQCAPLHDIGKIAIRDDILQKPGRLTNEEFEEMKKHTLYGKVTFEKTLQEINNQMFIDTAVNMIYYHHERWDGQGYPVGLARKNIPIEARIMSIADAYDAITSKRVYKAAKTHEQAKAIILEMSGKQFDPDLVTIFLSIEQTIKAIADTYGDKE
jgi:response regulator RpfG family c-di-GMP phosphodiesterase